MGNDGGSIPDRRDLVRNKPKAEQADRHNQMIARWFFCALSKHPLQEPIVSCELGKLYNKDAIIEYLLDRSAFGDGEEICGHIRSLKDVKTLILTSNPTPVAESADASERRVQFVCPLTLKEMSGTHPFVYLSTCGCVLSRAGLRALSDSSGTPPSEVAENPDGGEQQHEQKDVCPQCATKFTQSTDIVLLNPSADEESRMRETMEVRRAVEALHRPKKGKKRKADDVQPSSGAVLEPPTKRTDVAFKKSRTSTPQPVPATTNAMATSRAVADSLALEEKKRKNGMSEAVKSLYTPKGGVPRKETFMTRGTFTRYA